MYRNTKGKIAVRNNAGKTSPAATAPMANAYVNATILEKIENLAATFCHRKCNETSSRFLFLNIKGNDKSYQTPNRRKPLGKLRKKEEQQIDYIARSLSTHTAQSLRSDRARTRFGRYVATENKPTLHSLCRELKALLDLLLRTTKRPVRPQKGPKLRSFLNPHRNTFRFVSIGVSVEILRRKQVGLFLACFYSLRSDLSDLHSLDSDLSGLRKDSSWFASTHYVATCQTSNRYIATCQASERSSFAFSFESSSKRAFRFVSIGVSFEILRRKQVGLFLAYFYSLHSDLSDLQLST
ncbi:hypothetical protein F2Q69_00021453 [Brassica cretica]|uniref:Uncharacterized protein n=1 Tax=Brassica cretica TaxID=69181 RepID=A0A8S9Q624_BRACR|nr:hypothetical protein F2Q69_00021453 [Brassica cretica]